MGVLQCLCSGASPVQDLSGNMLAGNILQTLFQLYEAHIFYIGSVHNHAKDWFSLKNIWFWRMFPPPFPWEEKILKNLKARLSWVWIVLSSLVFFLIMYPTHVGPPFLFLCNSMTLRKTWENALKKQNKNNTGQVL